MSTFQQFVDDAVHQAKAKLLSQRADEDWWDLTIVTDIVELEQYYKQHNIAGAIDYIVADTKQDQTKTKLKLILNNKQ